MRGEGPIPFQEIAARCLAIYPTLLERWLPDGRQRGRWWQGARNPTRADRKPGSFVVELRLGWWRDYATGDKGGDPISLYAYLRGVGQGEAAKELAAELGLDTSAEPRRWRAPAPPPRPPEERTRDHDRDAAQRRAVAHAIWRKAKPAAGTEVEAYLHHRGITLPVPASLRFASLKHRDACHPVPAMVAAMQVRDGLVGVHRTFLAPGGASKLKLALSDERGRFKGWAETKMMLGSAEGAAVRLSPGSPNLVLAEGIETALSVLQVAPGWTVWAALSAGNLARVAIPDGTRRLVIVADGDEKPDLRAEFDRRREAAMRREGLRQAQLAMEALTGLGIATRILVPRANGDMNDVLRDEPELAREIGGYLQGLLEERAAA